MDRRTIKLLGALTASVAIVMVAALFLGGDDPTSGAQGSDAASLAERGGGESWLAPLGVRAAAVDPARPRRVGPQSRFRRPVVAIHTERPPAPTTPAEPPVMPDAAAVAASEAYLAAMPVVRQQVEAAIARFKPALRNVCWRDVVPASASLPVEASFDAEGNLLALSIGDDPDAAGIGACVRDQPLPLDIDAPGLAITVQATIDLP